VGSDLRSSGGDAIIAGMLPPHLRYRIANGYKLVVDARVPQPLLYDMAADPGETRDIGAERPDFVEALSVGLPEPWDLPEPAPEDLERMKALGYVGG
jgi:hypothetical protein